MTFLFVEDVYFLTGLPFQGMALPANPQLPGDVRLIDLAYDDCLRSNPMSGLVVLIKEMGVIFH